MTLYKNITANLFGSAFAGLIGIVFMPYYVSIMGAESFAIIGVYVSLANMLSVIDMGISPTLNREVASGTINNNIERIRNVLCSLEFLFIPIVIGVALLLFCFSTFVASEWLNGNTLPVVTIEESLEIMAIVIALHFLINFYSAGISGLQRQVVLNSVNVAMITMRYGGVIPIMSFFTPSPVVFFKWQLAISLLHIMLIRYLLWKWLRLPGHISSPKISIFREVWKFSLGVSIVNLLGVVAINLDKILLSKMLSLEDFGYYSVASIIAMSIAPRLASPFFSAVYPRFTQYVKQNNRDSIVALYRQCSLLVSVTITPVTVFISYFAYDILMIWTGSIITAQYASAALVLLAIGCYFNGVMYIPYALQLAYGKTKIAMFVNAISLLCIGPMMIGVYPYFGIIGVAFSWLIVNLFSVAFSIVLIHIYILEGVGLIRIFYDNIMVIGSTVFVGYLLKCYLTTPEFIQLLFAILLLYCASFICVSEIRKNLINLLSNLLIPYAK